MHFLTDLWLPIVLSGVAVFIVSSILHMVLPIHKGDFKKMPNEAKVLEAMRNENIQPAEYMFPCAGSMKEMCTPEMVDKYKLGPVGFMRVLPNGTPNMVKCLVMWFLYSILISIFVAYVTRYRMMGGEEFFVVFRLSGAVAFLGYGLSCLPDLIWKGASWVCTLKYVIDGAIYAAATAVIFCLLWPAEFTMP